ncbi:hypothetical protein EJB05_01405, partial [Eragrostis curvula]
MLQLIAGFLSNGTSEGESDTNVEVKICKIGMRQSLFLSKIHHATRNVTLGIRSPIEHTCCALLTPAVNALRREKISGRIKNHLSLFQISIRKLYYKLGINQVSKDMTCPNPGLMKQAKTIIQSEH